jgi:hypothetical protein
LIGRHGDLPHTCMVSPIINSPTRVVGLVQLIEAPLTDQNRPKSVVCIRFSCSCTSYGFGQIYYDIVVPHRIFSLP